MVSENAYAWIGNAENSFDFGFLEQYLKDGYGFLKGMERLKRWWNLFHF
jgi:hypothetical protein